MTQPFLTPQGRSTTCKDQATEQTSKKLRSACDRCHSAKVRCSGKSPCERCQKDNLPCRYSFRANLGKPKGSLNKKTKETLRRLAEGAPPEGLLESRHIRRILSLSRSEKASNSSSNSSSSSNNNNNNAIFSPAVVVDKGPQTTSVFPSSTGLGSPNNDRDQDQDQDLCNGASASFIEPPPRTPLSQTYSLLDMEHVDALNEEIPGIVGTPCSISILDHLPTIPDPCMDSDGSINLGLGCDAYNTPSCDRLETFNSLAAQCAGLPVDHQPHQHNIASTNSSTPSFDLSPRLNSLHKLSTPITPFKPPQIDFCSCLQTVANCIGQIRAIEQRESPMSLENNLHHYPIALSTVSSALKCPTCSSDLQTLLLGSMVMSTVSKWAHWLVSPPAGLGSTFQVQYSSEYVASEDDSRIVRAVLTARALANSRQVVSLFRDRLRNVSTVEMLQMDFLQSQVSSVANSLESSITKFNSHGLFADSNQPL
ncbi:hypothetical protein EYB26_001583 [Talaromyces marneffei]|uniref:uncharacterized protein n=1 Tax=Talaromyces marneffei TaxID=37727 RepID=UPI0012A7F0E7|nr:uncharacterized protein EYB26_001583 [Talaromyces marneffei]QGA13931.1 hypothetical protein EYB26_001583 [Talaromyces marneffei]